MIIKLNESYVKPYTGLFWYINNKVVGLVFDVERSANNATAYRHHYQVWNSIKDDYKVNGKIVPYNYFPRGRVYISAMPGLDTDFTGYIPRIDMDPCLNTPECKEKIANYFNLYATGNFIKPIFTYDKEHYNCVECRGTLYEN